MKANSDADYEKSKRTSTNLLAQILLDWLEGRAEPLFSTAVQDTLIQMWDDESDSSSADIEGVNDAVDFTVSPGA